MVTFEGEIHTLLKKQRRTRKVRRIKGIAMMQWVNHLQNNIFVNPPPLLLSCEISGALHLAQLRLTAGRQAGRQADKIQVNFQNWL